MRFNPLSIFIILSLFTIISISKILEIADYYPNEHYYIITFIYISFSITILFQIEKINYISLMFFFNITVFVFLGGRFFTYYFLPYPSNLFDLSFMANYKASPEAALSTFNKVIFFIVFSNFAYLASMKSSSKTNIIRLPAITSPIIINLIWLITLFLIVLNIQAEINTLQYVKKLGYLARYSSQAEYYKPGSGLINIFMFIFIGLSFGLSNNRKIRIITYIGLFTYACLVLLSGQRELFVTVLLFGIWYIGKDKKVSLMKTIIIFLLIALSLLLFMNFSYRSGDYTTSLIDKIVNLIHAQGTTLGVITFGLNEIKQFPPYAYITSLLPGAARILTIVEPNIVLQKYDLGFGSYVAHMANAHMYKQGYGLGWSIIGNLSVFSYNIFIIFILLSSIWGWFIRLLDSNKTPLIISLSYALATKIFFVARAEINTVLHTIILFSICYFIFLLADQLIKKAFYYEYTKKSPT